GECPMCRRTAAWVTAHAAPDSIELLTCQDESRSARFPDISTDDCMTAMQLVEPDGRVCAGERALPGILARTRGWRWAAPLLRLPGVMLAARPVYALVARNRLALSSLFIAKDPDGAACGLDGDCK